MQLSAGEALDLSRESKQTLLQYGVGEAPTDSFARRCLLARRLVERGVRFVQIFLEEQPWDSHADLAANHRAACQRTDQPVAALLRDLKQRGLLDSTLVIWGGEFGRTPTTQKSGDIYTGRDHNMQAFSSWMAGGGARGGTTWGKTDDFGHSVVQDPVSVHDFHATILHLLGLHHQHLFFERSGLEERLTGIAPPRVVTEILT
jgi:arylsulfatase A-like enzyme